MLTYQDAVNSFWNIVAHLELWIDHLESKDLITIVPMLIALMAVFFGPLMTFRLGKRQIRIQEDIAAKQVETQAAIARRQIADSISTKRQNWIDELRIDGAKFVTVVGRIQELTRPRRRDFVEAKQMIEESKELFVAEMEARELGARIRLRLNPNEAEHNKLVELIGNIDSTMNKNRRNEDEATTAQLFNDAIDAVVRHLQTILKHEWDRVKRGDI